MEYKKLLCFFFILCLLILPGCQMLDTSKAELFLQAFAQLQEQKDLFVRDEHYYGADKNNLELLSVWQEWRHGESFYCEDDKDARKLCYNGKKWESNPPRQPQWEERSYVESHSSWWKNVSPREYLTGNVTIHRDGAFTVLQHVNDLGSNNCTLSRQIQTYTFYINSDGNIKRITSELVSYNSTEIDPNQIHSVSKSEYYIDIIDAQTAANTIKEQYRFMLQS